MATQTPTENRLVLDQTKKEDRRVALATLVGTAIEWYDYFIYASAAALVLVPLFFEPFKETYGAVAGQILAFATVGVSFFFRPLGAMVAGHLGDKLGRKIMLVVTLILMGAATTLIGLLPTYASAGMLAPVLLVALRILQGFSAGGEWGGAALMAVEHAPTEKRGLFGGFPQIGVPVGMLMATAVLGIMSAVTTEEQFLAWGWRVPFILSLGLVVVGIWIRKGVQESPVFQEIKKSEEKVHLPLVQMFKYSGKQVALGALTFAGNSAMGYMITGGYILAYTTQHLEVPRTTMLNLVTLAAAAWVVTTLFAAKLSDKITRQRTFQIGFVLQLIWLLPMFLLIDTARPWIIALSMVTATLGLGMTYGPTSAMFAEMFPAKVRYSGAGITYAFGSIIGGAFAPMIAAALFAKFGTNVAVVGYLMTFSLIGLIAVSVLKDRTGGALDASATDIEGQAQLEAALAKGAEDMGARSVTFDQDSGY
ncbi:MAG: MFS transporter [Actinomycetaceae bacterium]|nr:MFS transporter [Actinomycetaceae bacterium]